MKTIFILTLMVYIGTTSRLANHINSGGKRLWLSYLPIALLCMLFATIPIPLPVFYAAVYIAGFSSMLFLDSRKMINWLFINLQFLFFVSMHLIMLGIRAYSTNTDVHHILYSPAFRMSSLGAVALINSLINTALQKSMHEKLTDVIGKDSQVQQMFVAFTWFCVCFVMLDSIPCLFVLPATFPILFLIGSNILLLFLVVLFANRTYVITRNAYLKEENLRLKEEEARQHYRMKLLEQKAYKDPLTKAYTRWYALTNISSMLENGEDFTLVFIDLDRLKRINDLHGHQAGDVYLQRFSSFLRSKLHPNDVFARYGGDEFLILMPDTSKADCQELMEAIRLEAKKPQPDGCGTAFSYGIAQAYAGLGLCAEDWIDMADQSMYEDKKLQRAQMEDSQ